MKKNCYNCAHLDFESGDVDDSEGFVCERKYFHHGPEENDMINKMDRESYREKAKVCFKQKSPAKNVSEGVE